MGVVRGGGGKGKVWEGKMYADTTRLQATDEPALICTVEQIGQRGQMQKYGCTNICTSEPAVACCVRPQCSRAMSIQLDQCVKSIATLQLGSSIASFTELSCFYSVAAVLSQPHWTSTTHSTMQ